MNIYSCTLPLSLCMRALGGGGCAWHLALLRPCIATISVVEQQHPNELFPWIATNRRPHPWKKGLTPGSRTLPSPVPMLLRGDVPGQWDPCVSDTYPWLEK